MFNKHILFYHDQTQLSGSWIICFCPRCVGWVALGRTFSSDRGFISLEGLLFIPRLLGLGLYTGSSLSEQDESLLRYRDARR